MKFLDQAKIYIKSGDGGAGCIAFRREKFIPEGGPNGGDGGKGGDVILKCVPGLNTLIDFRYAQHYKAKNGGQGMGKDRHGAKGNDVVIKVPLGTQIFDAESDELVVDMVEEGQTFFLARGGNGGWGNARFKSSTNQAPRRANPGEAGIEGWFWLRLKLFADVGLVGLPNAGKSTFLASCTRAAPKIADYPFTTLYPNLGVFRADDKEIVIADLPGLIEGAHDGHGLGDRFLGHLERCRVLIHLISLEGCQIEKDYELIKKEVELYGHGVDKKPCVVVLSKADMAETDAIEEARNKIAKLTQEKPWVISSLSNMGTAELLRRVIKLVEQEKYAQMPHTSENQWSPL